MYDLGMRHAHTGMFNGHRATPRLATRATSTMDPETYKQIYRKPVPPAQVVEDDHSYKDNIRLLDCNHFWRRLGVPLQRNTCRRLWFVNDWTGIAGCIFTWFLIIFGEIVFFLFVLIPFRDPMYSAVNAVFSLVCAFLGFAAHLRAMFSDPVSWGANCVKNIHSPNLISWLGLRYS